MMKNAPIKRYMANELADLRSRGESRSDWAKSASTTQAEIETSIAADSDEAGMLVDWDKASVEMPQRKAPLNIRVDREVLDYFRSTGRGYQTRINAVLRSYVDQMGNRR